ncbi:Gfo/Idh/MocA family protein [Streptomyces sp. NPDC059455]|uniref:Gfo/Idh/MocA family protein n=1 Tax=Streptomyces sp. NPDC059455 TaxID=3346837 RepID=UPI00368E4CAF
MTEIDDIRVGILGCGDVLGRYVPGLRRYPELRIVRCADIDTDRARKAAEEFGIPASGSPDELLADSEVDLVVNLTPPVFHAATTAQALTAGKHVYVEKPIATTVEDALDLFALAHKHDRLLGSATDTFLGSAPQTARAAIDGKRIGEPIAVTVFVPHSKVETRHPDPTAFFGPGGGPLLDLGPYYIGSLVSLLGPVTHVYGATRRGADQRVVTSPQRRVDTVPVNVDTHATAVLRFASGVLGTVMMSFEVWDHHLPHAEIYGTEGTLSLPWPLNYDGDVTLKRHEDPDWQVLEPVVAPVAAPGPDQFLRGRGVRDMAGALAGGPLRVGAELGLHVFEILDAIEASGRDNAVIALRSTCARPAPVE